ncbi:MAG: DUF547 domain-containing protein [Gammaproteobacteria bacterium]
MTVSIRPRKSPQPWFGWVPILLSLAAVGPGLAAGSQSLHHTFDAVLRAHVAEGDVSYPGIAGDVRFAEYLQKLARIDPDALATREEKLAYWINAYNAFAIKGILGGSSPSTLFGRVAYFKLREYRAGGRDINLYDLERKVLIPMGDPRIHFAIVCASQSCPWLRSEAYTPDRIEQQLDDSARQFINDPSRNHFDSARKVAYLSQIFDWFAEDFERNSGSVLGYLAPYLKDQRLARELKNGEYTIKHLDYNWNLNGTPPED